jgi:hypothetical protein
MFILITGGKLRDDGGVDDLTIETPVVRTFEEAVDTHRVYVKRHPAAVQLGWDFVIRTEPVHRLWVFDPNRFMDRHGLPRHPSYPNWALLG